MRNAKNRTEKATMACGGRSAISNSRPWANEKFRLTIEEQCQIAGEDLEIAARSYKTNTGGISCFFFDQRQWTVTGHLRHSRRRWDWVNAGITEERTRQNPVEWDAPTKEAGRAGRAEYTVWEEMF